MTTNLSGVENKVFINGRAKFFSKGVQIDFKGDPEDKVGIRKFLLRILEEEKIFLPDDSGTDISSNVFSGKVNIKIELRKGKRNQMRAIIDLSSVQK